MNQADRNAKVIWDYMLLHQTLRPMDAIFALGSNDTRVADRSADLYLAGYAPVIIFSGNRGKNPRLDRPEAEVFADIAFARGVPKDKIIKEDRSTNTGENIEFTKRLLKEKGLNYSSFILVQKPYMERRVYAAFCKQWPEAKCVVTSPQIAYDQYADPAHHIDRDRFINVMVGDLLRIKEYPARGFQIPQDIPPTVWTAYETLVQMGFNRYVPLP